MEEGKKRVISPNSHNTSTTQNAGSKTTAKRSQNIQSLTLKQKHSKTSPHKQTVTLSHPISMLKSHKQVSTTSFEASNDFSVTMRQSSISAISANNGATNQMLPTDLQQKHSKIGMTAQQSKHQYLTNNPQQQTFSSTAQNTTMLMAASKQLQTSGLNINTTQDRTTGSGQICKPVTSPPVDQKGIARTNQAVLPSQSSVVILSNKHQKSKKAIGGGAPNQETPSRLQSHQRNSYSGNHLSLLNKNSQMAKVEMSRQASGKDEDVPMSATKIESQPTSSFSWYVKQKNQNFGPNTALSIEPQHASASGMRQSQPASARHEYLRANQQCVSVVGGIENEQQQLATIGCDNSSQLSISTVSARMATVHAVPKGSQTNKDQQTKVTSKKSQLQQMSPGQKTRNSLLGVSAGSKVVTTATGSKKIMMQSATSQNPVQQLSLSKQQTFMTNNSVMTPTSGVGKSSMLMASASQFNTARPTKDQEQRQQHQVQSRTLQQRISTNLASASGPVVNKSGMDILVVTSQPAIEPNQVGMAERIKRRKSMLQTSLGSASFNQVIPELNSSNANNNNNNIGTVTTSSKRRDTIQTVPSEFERNDSPSKKRTKVPPTQHCKRQRDIGDGFVKPKGVHKKTNQILAQGSLTTRNPEETPIAMKQDMSNRDATSNSSVKQLFKAKNYINAKKPANSTIANPITKPAPYTSQSSSIQLVTVNQNKRASSVMKPKGASQTIAPHFKQQNKTSCAQSSIKKRTMADIHALTSSQKLAQTPQNYKRGNTANTLNEQEPSGTDRDGDDAAEEKLENIEMEEEMPKQPSSKLCLDNLNDSVQSSGSEESHIFQTQDRSPISTVPKVQICLRSFPQKQQQFSKGGGGAFEESKFSDKSSSNPYIDSSNQKKSIILTNDGGSKTKQNLRLPQYLNRNTMNEDSSTGILGDGFLQNMLAVDQQSSIKLSSASQQQQQLLLPSHIDDSSHQSILVHHQNQSQITQNQHQHQQQQQYNSYLRLSDPFQQGGGSTTRDGQTGGDTEMINIADLDSSFIPAEDMGTQKVSNMRKLEQSSSKSLSKPNMITPRSMQKYHQLGGFGASQSLRLGGNGGAAMAAGPSGMLHKRVTSLKSSPKIDEFYGSSSLHLALHNSSSCNPNNSSMMSSSYAALGPQQNKQQQRTLNLISPVNNSLLQHEDKKNNLSSLRQIPPNSAQNASLSSRSKTTPYNFTFNSHLRADVSGFRNAYHGTGGVGEDNSDRLSSSQTSNLFKRSSSNMVNNPSNKNHKTGTAIVKPGQVQNPPASLSKKRSFQHQQHQTRNNPMLPTKAVTLNTERSAFEKTSPAATGSSVRNFVFKSMEGATFAKLREQEEAESESREIKLDPEVHSAHTMLPTKKASATAASVPPMTELKKGSLAPGGSVSNRDNQMKIVIGSSSTQDDQMMVEGEAASAVKQDGQNGEDTSDRISMGLGQLLKSAKTFKNNNLNNFNPMLESIKKSFRSILGSSTAPGQQEDEAPSSMITMAYEASANGGAASFGGGPQEESKQASAQIVVEDDLKTITQQKNHRKLLQANEALITTVEKPTPKLQHQLNRGSGQSFSQKNSLSRRKERKPPVQLGIARQLFSNTEPHDKEAQKRRLLSNNNYNCATDDKTPIKKCTSDEQMSKQEDLPSSMSKMRSQQPESTEKNLRQRSRDFVPPPSLGIVKDETGESSMDTPGSSGRKRRAGTILQKFSTMTLNQIDPGCDPMGSPSDCLLQFGHLLNHEEKLEILSYAEVWFVGTQQAKQIRKTTQLTNKERLGRGNSRSPVQNTGLGASAQPNNATHNTANATRKQSQSRSRGSGLLNTLQRNNNASNSTKQQSGTSGLSRRRGVHFTHNHGYDTQAGFYQAIIGDHLAYRYQTLEELGRGTFGQVLRCRDHKTGNMVAIKVSKNLNQAGLDNCQREVRLLKHANSVSSQYSGRIVSLLDDFRFRNHLCLVFELLGSNDLYKEIKRSQMTGLARISQIKQVVEQIAMGLCHLKECGIVHCDLKPENVIYTSEAKNEVKIVDLGSACSHKERGFAYVCSRYYRAPEMVLSRKADYTCAVDMWSLGCITAELYNGLPLFLASSQNELIEYQSLYCGGFNQEDVVKYNDYKPYLDLNTPSGVPVPIPDPKPTHKSVKPKVVSSVIKEVLCRKKRPDTDEVIDMKLTDDEILSLVSQDERLMIDFINNCLQLRPDDRITCENALQHPFISR